MQTLHWNDLPVRHALAALKRERPFVYGLTNYIAANLSANVLLAVGAAPAIGAAPDWPASFAAGAHALWINGAALVSDTLTALQEAARSAQAAGTPWVFDPVAFGAGSAKYDQALQSLLAYQPTVIRGNASELIALAGGAATGKGVETQTHSGDALAHIKRLAQSTGAVVAVSGECDYVTDGVNVCAIAGGDARLTQVTGAGCSLGALIAALLAVSDSTFDAACAAHALYAVAAERAAGARGTGSFAVAFLDELSELDPAEA